MGSISLAYLIAEDEAQPGAMTEVGSVQVFTFATALLLRREPGVDGGYVFEREVSVSIGFPGRVLPTRGADLSWMRLEVKADPKQGISRGDWLCLAEAPYSSHMAVCRKFKGPNRRGRDAAEAMSFATRREAEVWLAEKETDFWETGSMQTAALMGDAFTEKFLSSARNTGANARYVLGVCPALEGSESPVQAAEDAIFRSRRVGDLLAMTKNGSLRFAYQGAGVAPSLRPAVRDARFAVMAMSIRQALAGPNIDSTPFLGRPVVDWVDQLYRENLNQLNRKDEPEAVLANCPLEEIDWQAAGSRRAQLFYADDKASGQDEP